MKYIALPVLLAGLLAAADIRVAGIAKVEIKVADLARAQRFYTGVLGIADGVNERQSVVLVPNRKGTSDHHLARFWLECQCEQREITDPDGNPIVLTPFLRSAPSRSRLGRISARLRHVGIQVRDLDVAAAFYRDNLGLVPEELNHGKTRWFNMHLPNGEYIQMQLTPPDGSYRFEHFGLDVKDAHRAYELLLRRGVPPHAAFEPVVGYARHLKINFADPDGTLVELMELGAAKESEKREK